MQWNQTRGFVTSQLRALRASISLLKKSDRKFWREMQNYFEKIYQLLRQGSKLISKICFHKSLEGNNSSAISRTSKGIWKSAKINKKRSFWLI